MAIEPKFAVGKFLDRKQAADYIGLSDFWLERHCHNPDAPRWFRHGRKCYYRRSDLDAWLKVQQEQHDARLDAWRVGKARRSTAPSDEALDSSYTERWGNVEVNPNPNATAQLREAFAKLNPQQARTLARALQSLADNNTP